MHQTELCEEPSFQDHSLSLIPKVDHRAQYHGGINVERDEIGCSLSIELGKVRAQGIRIAAMSCSAICVFMPILSTSMRSKQPARQ